MKCNLRVFVFLGFLALMVSGCQKCYFWSDPNSAVIPLPVAPLEGIVTNNTRPVFRWEWDNNNCYPKGFKINIGKFYLTGNEIQHDYSVYWGNVDRLDRQLSLDEDLIMGENYFWKVAAIHELYGDDDVEWYIYYSPWQHFIVGPVCEGVPLTAPESMWPTGDIAYEPQPFIWEYDDPSCTPKGYHLQVSNNSDFTEIVRDVRNNNASKFWKIQGVPMVCQEYFWRVRAIDGETSGPWSVVLSYRLLGNCYNQPLAEDEAEDIPGLAPVCGDGVVNGDEECDGDDLTMCLSGQVCENCQCITYMDAEEQSNNYEALQNTNCRESDFPESELVETLMEGDLADLIALNPEYTHGLFELESGNQCWIWLGLMDGDENPFANLNVEIVDPLQAPAENTCSTNLEESQCIAAGGEWTAGIAAPYCVCPED